MAYEGAVTTKSRKSREPKNLYIPEDPQDAYRLAQNCVQLWQDRDDRIQEYRDAYALGKEPLKAYEERIAVHDIPILVDKFAEELARCDLHISVAPGTAHDREPSQHIEDAAYWWLLEVQARHTAALHATFKYEAAHYLSGDGWLVAECLSDPRDQSRGFPWLVRLLDPVTIYPDRTDGQPCCVVHRYELTEDELAEYWGDRYRVATRREELGPITGFGFGPTVHGGTAATYRTCYGFYSDTHTAVLLEGGDFLKPPTPHGYGASPLVIAVAPGVPWRRYYQRAEDHVPLVGPSLIRATIDVVKDKARIAARTMRVLTKTAAPPHLFATSDPDATVEDVDVEPNAVTIGRQGDSLTPIVPPPVYFQYASNLMALEQDQINRGTVAPALFGEGVPGSGADRTKQLGTAFSKPELYLEQLSAWYAALLKLALRQFAYFGPPDMMFIARDRTTGLRTAANRLSPVEVIGADARLEVKFANMLSQDKQAMGMLAATLIDRGVISHEYALDDLLEVDNPTEVMRQARADNYYRQPENLALASTWDKAHDEMDPIGARLAQMQFPVLWQRFVQGLQPAPPGQGTQQGAMGGGPTGPPQGMLGGLPLGGPPGQGAPPLAGAGMPSAALPPGLGAGAGLPPGLMALGPPQPGAGIQSILPPGVMG